MSENADQSLELGGQQEVTQFETWAREQLAGVELGDERRTHRLVKLLSSVAKRPGKTLPEQCQQAAPLKASYRLLKTPVLEPEDIIASSSMATVEQIRSRHLEGALLAIQDTTTLNFTTHEALAGRGPISNNATTKGFLAHTSLLVSESGPVHGLLECEVYARGQTAQKARKLGERNRQPSAQKEGHRWLFSVAQSKIQAAVQGG